jgi:hypothetical protein
MRSILELRADLVVLLLVSMLALLWLVYQILLRPLLLPKPILALLQEAYQILLLLMRSTLEIREEQMLLL